MLDPATFVAAAARHGLDFYTSVPCSYLTPLFNHVAGSGAAPFITAVNEGDAVAIAAGAWLGGRRPIVMFQNSGLGNAVNPLTSLAHTCRVPLLLVVTLRGDPDGAADEPQHGLMGRITAGMLETMAIPWRFLPDDDDGFRAAVAEEATALAATSLPRAFVMQKGSVATSAAAPPAAPPATSRVRPSTGAAPPASASRTEMLAALQRAAGPRDLLLASTGYAGRELYALDDRPNQFYMVGSMGCIASLALGLALARPDLRVVAIDGDGALLMRLGGLATVGQLAPANLCHVLLDNGIHESTGGQPTASPWVDFPAVAAACGYRSAGRAATPDALADWLAYPAAGPRFVHVPILAGVPVGLPRPRVTPAETAHRLRDHVAGITP